MSSIQRDQGSIPQRNTGYGSLEKSGTYEDVKQVFAFRDRYTAQEVFGVMRPQVELHGDLTLPKFRSLMQRQFPQLTKMINFSDEGKRVTTDALDLFFNLMDTDRDGYVDVDDLEVGLKKVFPMGSAPVRAQDRAKVSANTIFTKIDMDVKERVFMTDMERFVLQHLRHITQINLVGKQRQSLNL